MLSPKRRNSEIGTEKGMTTRFILVRHGRTAWNREVRFRGREDLPLDEAGLEQAEAAGRRIAATWSVSAVYTSPLLRARQTAQAIAQNLGLAPQPLEGLLDLDYGRWQGLSPQEVEQRYGDLYPAWLRSPQTVRFPGGESLAQVRERALAAVLELARRHPGETVVLVGHQAVNKVLLCAVLGLDDSHFWRIEQDTGAINVFEYRGGTFVVTLLNDTCHLPTPLGRGKTKEHGHGAIHSNSQGNLPPGLGKGQP
jgi:broad specificity phosphatase PhoE